MSPVHGLVIALAAALGCASGAAAQDSAAVAIARIEVRPEAMILGVNDTARVTAVAYDDAGRKLDVPMLFFSSSRRNLSVDQTGLVRALGPGEYRIMAAVRGDTLRGEARVTVRWPALESIEIAATPQHSGSHQRGIAVSP